MMAVRAVDDVSQKGPVLACGHHDNRSAGDIRGDEAADHRVSKPPPPPTTSSVRQACDALQAEAEQNTRHLIITLQQAQHNTVPPPQGRHQQQQRQLIDDDGSLMTHEDVATPLPAGMELPEHEMAKPTVFHSSSYPAFPVTRVAESAQLRCRELDHEVLQYAIELVRKASAGLPHGVVTGHLLHRLFIACICAAHKMAYDSSFKASDFGKLFGLPRREILRMEVALLKACDWSLFP